jgi:hypothetical protein
LASFPRNPQPAEPEPSTPPAGARSPKNWPPMDETTGRPRYFVG